MTNTTTNYQILMAYYREAIKTNPTKIVEWEMYVKPGEYASIEKSLVRAVDSIHSDDDTIGIQTLSANDDGSVSVVSTTIDREHFSKSYVRFVDVESSFISHFGTYNVVKTMGKFVEAGRVPVVADETQYGYQKQLAKYILDNNYYNLMVDGDIILEVSADTGISNLEKKYIARSNSTYCSATKGCYDYSTDNHNEKYFIRSQWIPEITKCYTFNLHSSFIN